MKVPETIYEEFLSGGRVCPMPPCWADMHRMIAEEHRSRGLGAVPNPLILAAWHDTPDKYKTMRFRLHLQYAANCGILEEVCTYLRSLPPDDWYTGGPY
jgi:hypothetical protein